MEPLWKHEALRLKQEWGEGYSEHCLNSCYEGLRVNGGNKRETGSGGHSGDDQRLEATASC